MRSRLLRDTTWILGAVCAAYAALSVWDRGLGVDARAYWLAWSGPMYLEAPGTPDAYLYSPVFAQALWPLAQLPWPAFVAIFTVGVGSALAWLLKPLGWKWGAPLWLAGLPEIVSGNIFILMALVAVAGFSRPEAWAFIALTKITPCVGPLWFLARGEWWNLGRSLIALGVIVGVSAATAPDLWREWFDFLILHAGASTAPIGSPVLPPPAVRVPLGVALVIWGARQDRRWCIPAAMVMCTPVLWLGSFTLLAAIPRMRKRHEENATPAANQSIERRLG